MDFTQLLAFAVEQGASDCHLSSGESPMLRIHGDLKKLDHPLLTQEEVHAMVFDMMNDPQRKAFEETHDTVNRIIDVFPPAQQSQIRTQFAESIEAVITQSLLKRKAGDRGAAVEVMTGTTAVRNLIREEKIHQLPAPCR